MKSGTRSASQLCELRQLNWAVGGIATGVGVSEDGVKIS